MIDDYDPAKHTTIAELNYIDAWRILEARREMEAHRAANAKARSSVPASGGRTTKTIGG